MQRPKKTALAARTEAPKPAPAIETGLAELVDEGAELVEDIAEQVGRDGSVLRKKAHEIEQEGRKAGSLIWDMLTKPGTATRVMAEARDKLTRGR